MPALVIEHMHLVPLEERARFAVAHERIFVPAVPQPLEDIDILLGDVIALGLREMFILIVVERRPGVSSRGRFGVAAHG